MFIRFMRYEELPVTLTPNEGYNFITDSDTRTQNKTW